MKQGFIHIPKTGGSSFVIHLNSQLPGRIRRCGVFEFMNFIDSVREDEIVYGHAPAFLFMRESPDRRLYTILRDPVRRAISNYRFILSQPNHRMYRHITARKLSLAACYEHPILRHEMGNLQTKMLGWMPELNWSLPALDVDGRFAFERDFVSYLLCEPSADTLKCAKERLSHDLGFAVLERPETVCRIFQEVSGIAVEAMPVINSTAPGDYEVTADDLAAIKQNTQLDQELYEYALSSLPVAVSSVDQR